MFLSWNKFLGWIYFWVSWHFCIGEYSGKSCCAKNLTLSWKPAEYVYIYDIYDMKSVMQRDLKKFKTMQKQIDIQKQLPTIVVHIIIKIKGFWVF